MVYLEIPIQDPTSVSIVHCPLSIANALKDIESHGLLVFGFRYQLPGRL